jgi:hypothetical protein
MENKRGGAWTHEETVLLIELWGLAFTLEERSIKKRSIFLILPLEVDLFKSD